MCGAWSYDNFEGVCYLHTVNSCCGQFGKRKNNTSKGYKMITKEYGNTGCGGISSEHKIQ